MPSALYTERCYRRKELGGGSEDPASVHTATSMEPTCQSLGARKAEIYRQCYRTISINTLYSVTLLLFEAKPLGGECGSQTQSPNRGIWMWLPGTRCGKTARTFRTENWILGNLHQIKIERHQLLTSPSLFLCKLICFGYLLTISRPRKITRISLPSCFS